MTTVLNFTPANKPGALAGFFDVELKNSMRIYGCSLFRKDGKCFATPPSRSYEKDGVTKWWAHVGFGDSATHRKFCESLCQAATAYVQAKGINLDAHAAPAGPQSGSVPAQAEEFDGYIPF